MATSDGSAHGGTGDRISFVDHFARHPGLQVLHEATTYHRKPAILVNPEVVVDPLHRRRFNRRLVGRAPVEGLARLEHVTVSDFGTVRLADGRLLAETVPPSGHVPHSRQPAVGTIECGVLAAQSGAGNYGHFLVEVLPRLALALGACPDDAPVLLHESSRRFAGALLEYAGIDPDRLRWLGDEPVHVERLYWPTRGDLHDLDVSPNAVAYLRTLGSHQRGEGGDRLFVGRTDATTRRLRNEDEILDLLAPHGFRRVVPGRLSFADQVRQFADAEAVIGVAGAALANLAFMRPGGAVVMLTPATMGPVFFWDLASQADQTLAVAWGATAPAPDGSSLADYEARPPRHLDFTVDPEVVIRAALATVTPPTNAPPT